MGQISTSRYSLVCALVGEDSHAREKEGPRKGQEGHGDVSSGRTPHLWKT